MENDVMLVGRDVQYFCDGVAQRAISSKVVHQLRANDSQNQIVVCVLDKTHYVRIKKSKILVKEGAFFT